MELPNGRRFFQNVLKKIFFNFWIEYLLFRVHHAWYLLDMWLYKCQLMTYIPTYLCSDVQLCTCLVYWIFNVEPFVASIDIKWIRPTRAFAKNRYFTSPVLKVTFADMYGNTVMHRTYHTWSSHNWTMHKPPLNCYTNSK